MKLHADRTDTRHVFTGYGDGYVMVNGRPIGPGASAPDSPGTAQQAQACVCPSLILSADGLITDWNAPSFAGLQATHLARLATLQCEIVLLGTGPTLRFLHPAMLQPLAAQRIGLEVMDLQAACRTYNILVAEGRKVAAALLFE
jgi:uncharacterized protein